MIRIHAGYLKGRYIKRVNIETTRETASMVREAVFNMLFAIEGNILDLFAGSGSYGLTALSLGADSCFFVDANKKAIKTIYENVNDLGLKNKVSIYNLNHEVFLKKNENTFNIIFLDPPYKFTNYLELLNLVSNHVVKLDGRIVLEIDKKNPVIEEFQDFHIEKQKVYGSKKIIIYVNNV
ncbi:MAG: 16S rRNA (guanine(966)-N(2))-methyltransferase RsmD [Acholeplasma sp.]|nr:16S rRNA (guanine(966)-N(2))-methyltransferase RsmD [Acholeplasma sp.]